MPAPLNILVTGGTGYIGQHLIPALVARGHRVRVLTRKESAKRVPAGGEPVVGDALDAESVTAALRADDSVIHLVGTPHPSPAKTEQFKHVDLVSIRATVAAAQRVAIYDLVYISVAQPAPIIRPWYVLGPSHWWPKLLWPFYKLAEFIPATRASAERLGLVTIEQMVAAIVSAVENPPARGRQRIVDVPGIRRARL